MGIASDGECIVQAICFSPDYDSRFEARIRPGDLDTPESLRSICGDLLDTDSVERIIFIVTKGGVAEFRKLCEFCRTHGLKLSGAEKGDEAVDLLTPEESELFQQASTEDESTD